MRNSSTSGKTLIMGLLRLRMRGRGCEEEDDCTETLMRAKPSDLESVVP